MLKTVLGVFAGYLLSGLIVVGLLAWALSYADAGDPTGYWARESAAGRAPPAAWWNALASGKGLCCSFADGKKIEDVDWGTDTGADGAIHYWVMLEHRKVPVPDDAVIGEPNKYGPAVVWPYTDSGGRTAIRCFMPGAGA